MNACASTLILVASLAAPVSAAECTRDQAIAAESVTDYLDSWENVYLFFKQYRHCYDGAIAEGADDKIQQLWAHRWAELPKMLALIKHDSEFKAFVFANVADEAFPQNAYALFVEHANKECPKGGEEFCRAVIKGEGTKK